MWAMLEIVARFCVAGCAVGAFIYAYVLLAEGWENHDFKGLQRAFFAFLLGLLLTFHVAWLAFPAWFAPNAQ
jgi:hypothetical protein